MFKLSCAVTETQKGQGCTNLASKSMLADLIQGYEQHIQVSGCDIDGIARGKLIHPEKFKMLDDGFGLCHL